jgi:ribosomal protein S12 methylthiotransferase accessory factor YcaO
MRKPKATQNFIERKKKASQRREVNSVLSPRQRLAELDKRLGEGKGAKKERARLKALMEEPIR